MVDRAVDVHVQIVGHDFHAGTLWFHQRRGAESATFAYEPTYLAARGAYALDPALPLVSGPLQTPVGQGTFGAFSDCSPDRWGRRLLEKARPGEGPFSEGDHLLGVRDDLRQGSLRFRDPESGVFLSEVSDSAPREPDLPRLLSYSDRVDRNDATAAQLEELLIAGGSLGGARPKAHVIDRNGRPAIAKFPKPSGDKWDVEAWEAVALELARRAMLNVAVANLYAIVGRSVLIVERFDRVGDERVGYISARTLLETTDTEQGSYLDLAEAIEEQSDRATSDLHELWGRIAFSILVSNTDDHLRNHGFLRLSSSGWCLSPAFDINPDPSPGAGQLATSIDGSSYEASLETLFGVAERFRLDDKELTETVALISATTSSWREVAEELGLGRAAIDSMEPAFEHGSADLARQVARVSSA